MKAKSLHELFNDICSSMEFHLDDHEFVYSSCYITDRSTMNDVFNDEPRRINVVTSYFQTNLDSAYSIILVISVFRCSWRMHVASAHLII